MRARLLAALQVRGPARTRVRDVTNPMENVAGMQGHMSSERRQPSLL